MRSHNMEKKITETTAKKIAAKYNMGKYIDYSSFDGWYYFENGQVGDGSNSRDEFFSYSDNKIHSLNDEEVETTLETPEDIKSKCLTRSFRAVTMQFKRETHKSWRTDWPDFLKWFYA